MGVEVIGVVGETNGFGDSMDAFRDAHAANSRILVNLAMGRKKNENGVAYDPASPANMWPRRMYHAEFGEMDVRDFREAKSAEEKGYRNEPYPKPVIAIYDPATEKAAMVAKNQELEGKLLAMQDMMMKMSEKVASMGAAQKESKKG